MTSMWSRFRGIAAAVACPSGGLRILKIELQEPSSGSPP